MALTDIIDCPDCSKPVQQRGLAGHRRFVHGATGAPDPVEVPTEESPVSAADLKSLMTRQDWVVRRLIGSLATDDKLVGRAFETEWERICHANPISCEATAMAPESAESEDEPPKQHRPLRDYLP